VVWVKGWLDLTGGFDITLIRFRLTLYFDLHMEFNLSKVLKALLFSTAEPLSVRDIQRVITRFHEEAQKCQLELKGLEANGENAEQEKESVEGGDGVVVESVAVGVMDAVEGEESVDMYSAQYVEQVPSLLTAAQIREAIDVIDRELEESGDVYRVQMTANGFRIVIVPEFSEWVRLLRNAPKPAKLRSSALETLAIVAYRQPATRAEMEAIRGVSVDSALNKLIELELITVVGRADAPGRPIQYGTTGKFLEFCGIANLSDLPASDVLSPSQLNEMIARATNATTPQDGDVGLASSEDDVEGELVVAREGDVEASESDEDESLVENEGEVIAGWSDDDDDSDGDDEDSEEDDDFDGDDDGEGGEGDEDYDDEEEEDDE
jgi:segregation and condensation protein B